jgi:site-specific DNA-cytosine methylase
MSDVQKYRAIGNSVAIPCAMFIMAGIAKASTGAGKEDDRSEGV